MARYERNIPAVSSEEQKRLASKRVLVAGCGGLGGYVTEYLGRIGVGHLTIVDGDIFSESNLNRQLLASDETLGKPKPQCARERLERVNPLVSVTPVCENIDAHNAQTLLTGHDVVIDALDSGSARKMLAKAARTYGVPVVSGAISGWHGRVFVLFPGDDADFLWEDETGLLAGNLSFTAAAVAAVEAAEAVKLLLGRPGVLKNCMLELDLLGGQWEEIPLEFSRQPEVQDV